MPPKGSTSGTELPENERVLRYWVEIRELRTGLVRTLPLSAVAKIPLTRPPRPREDVLQLQDGTTTREAKSLEDLAAHLRQRYPDPEYERTLRSERDHKAEQRRAEAMNRLTELLAELAVQEALQQIDLPDT